MIFFNFRTVPFDLYLYLWVKLMFGSHTTKLPLKENTYKFYREYIV